MPRIITFKILIEKWVHLNFTTIFHHFFEAICRYRKFKVPLFQNWKEFWMIVVIFSALKKVQWRLISWAGIGSVVFHKMSRFLPKLVGFGSTCGPPPQNSELSQFRWYTRWKLKDRKLIEKSEEFLNIL